ncbi:MAG: DUF4911 domain-containing protein [Caldimicrobium sp.]
MPSSLFLTSFHSKEKIVQLPSNYIGMFKFLLEGYDHLCSITVLDPKIALIKISYYHTEEDIIQAFIEDFKNFVKTF